MASKLHTYPYSKMPHWKITFYQNMSVQHFLGAFLAIILFLWRRIHSWNVFAHTVAFIFGASNPTRITVETAGQAWLQRLEGRRQKELLCAIAFQELEWDIISNVYFDGVENDFHKSWLMHIYLSDSNRTWSHNHLVRKQTLNRLAK